MENATIKVIAPDIRYAETTLSDANGQWFIDNMSFPDSVKFLVQAESPKGSTLSNLKIDDDKFPFVTGVPFAKKLLNQDIIDEQEISYISNEKNRLTYIDGVSTILLDEVVVTKRKIKNPENIYEVLAVRSFDYQFFEKRDVNSYETAIRYIAGIVRSKKDCIV